MGYPGAVHSRFEHSLCVYCLAEEATYMVVRNNQSLKEKQKRFLNDIVADGRNGLDVDKFDYIARDSLACVRGCNLRGCNFQFLRVLENINVIGDEICYRAKEYLTIHKLFSSRADLHRTVYMRARVKAIELMLEDALVKANDYLGNAASVEDSAAYWKLDDTTLKAIEISPNQELKEYTDIILRVGRRDLYQKSGGVTFKEEDIAVINVKIDLMDGTSDPVERIMFFQDYDRNDKFPIKNERISHLLPALYEDITVRVYSKKAELVVAVSKVFKNFS